MSAMSQPIHREWAGTDEAAIASGICKRNLSELRRQGLVKSRYVIVKQGATRGKLLWHLPSIYRWIESQSESSPEGVGCR